MDAWFIFSILTICYALVSFFRTFTSTLAVDIMREFAVGGGLMSVMMHLRLPPGPLPDGVPISLGGQCPAHQLDPDLPRAGAAQCAEHPAGGGKRRSAFSGTGITLKHPLSGALRQMIPLCRVATSPSGWRASFDGRTKNSKRRNPYDKNDFI